MECLTNIIGLTQNDCDCFEGDKPEDFSAINQSDSGLYITDEVDGAPLLSGVYAAIDCGRGDNVFTVLKTARENAVASFLTDLGAYRAMHRKSKEGFSGLIGRLKNSSSQSVASAFAGQLLRPIASRGRALVIEGIYLGFRDAHTTTATIDSDNPDFDSISVDVVNLAGKFGYQAFETPVTLDFSEDWNYTLSYPTADRYHLSNDYTCCGGPPDHESHLYASGFTSNDVSELLAKDCRGLSNCGDPYGTVIKAYTTCQDEDWLCRMDANMRRWTAKAIQFRAAANVYQYILDSGNINYYTALHKDAVYGKRNARNKGYETNTKFIAQQSPKGGCLGCAERTTTLSKGSLV